MMSTMAIFVQPMAVLMFCLAMGFLLGRVKVPVLPANSTLMTLLVAIAVNLLLRRFGFPMEIPGELKTFGFAFFSFAVGFSAGPSVSDAIRRDGMRQFARLASMSCVYFLAACAVAAVAIASSEWSEERIRGLLGGALTQATIIDSGSPADPVAYGVAYAAGVFWMIVFAQSIGPRLLRVTPLAAVKQYLDGIVGNAIPGFHLPARLVQMRAYRINRGSTIVGMSVGEIESSAPLRLEIVAVHRDGRAVVPAVSQGTRLEAGDVMVAIGDMRIVPGLPFGGVEELTDDCYLSPGFEFADIVLADDCSCVLDELTSRGILIREVVRNGRVLSERQFGHFRAGDVLKVAGLARPVDEFARARGYRRDDGAPSDLFLPVSAIAVAMVLGSVSIYGNALGSGFFSFGLGLGLGWWNHRRPCVAHIPPSALSLLRAIGLNLFIGVVALCAKLTPAETFSLNTLGLVAWASVVALVPLFATFAFGRYVLGLPPVVLLGGLCGSGTCTPALNALEDETGSSVFTAAYTIPYVVGNFLLTIIGCLAIWFYRR